MKVSTVFIPAAGTGSRLRPFTDHFPKALVGVGRRPAVSYVIDLYPPDARFVVAVGHKGEMLREYLATAYPDHDLTIVDVSCYEGPDAGLGRTIAESAHLLDAPFVFHAVDTILTEPWWTDVPADTDALAVAEAPEFAGRYRHALPDARGRCLALAEPSDGAVPGWLPYIGVSFVADVDRFATWARSTGGEVGEAEYLRRAIPAGVSTVYVKRWFDVGSPDGLAVTRAQVPRDDAAVSVKLTDTTFLHADRVVKVHASPGLPETKRIRGRALGTAVPPEIEAGRYCLSYRKVAGTPLSEKPDSAGLLSDLLGWLRDEFWQMPTLTGEAGALFRTACDRFYRQETTKRIAALPERFRQRRIGTVDGLPVGTSLAVAADALPWDRLRDGVPVRWHGDLHPNNILVTGSGEFVLIDWRDDFGGMTPPWGDLYYELAKLVHGYVLPDAIIDSGRFSVTTVDCGDTVSVVTDHPVTGDNLSCIDVMEERVRGYGFDWNKVMLVTGLVFLRMSPLYPDPDTSALLWATGVREMTRACAALVRS